MSVLIHGQQNGLSQYREAKVRDRVKLRDANKRAIKDSPGVFQMVDITVLQIDESYQRDELATATIRKIAQEWSWMRCGSINVAIRPNGENYVYDGQQRTAAAKMRGDIERLPALVFESYSAKEEADAFLGVNKFRSPVQAIEKFKAELVSENPVVQAVSRMIQAAGYRVTKRPADGHRELACVDCLCRQYSLSQELFLRIWPLVLELSGGGPVSYRVVEALIVIEKHLAKQGRSLEKPPLRDRLMRFSSNDLVTATRRAAEFYGKGGSTVWAQGIAKMLNKGCRANNHITLGRLSESDD